MGLAGLQALGGLAQKGVGYGSEIVAGGTNSERRLANDLLGMFEAFPAGGARGVNILDDVIESAIPATRYGADVARAATPDAIGAARAIAKGDALGRFWADEAKPISAAGRKAAEVYKIGQRLKLDPQFSGVSGKPKTVKIPDSGEFSAKPIGPIEEAAVSYMKSRGMDVTPLAEYAPLDPRRAQLIGAAYDMMAHDPDNPAVKRAYDAMIQETMDQYEALKSTGIDFKFLREGMKDPYARSPAMGYQDMVENGRLWVFPTDFGFGTSASFDPALNPLLKNVGRVGDKPDAVANDAFRAVHDAFGHFGPGNPFFRAPGEERAWIEHSRMYSPDARGAMTSETRGQNSWLNYGPYGRQNRTALGSDTVFADQKTGLLPAWTTQRLGMPSQDEMGLLDAYIARQWPQ
jgi:hypothetical protein